MLDTLEVYYYNHDNHNFKQLMLDTQLLLAKPGEICLQILVKYGCVSKTCVCVCTQRRALAIRFDFGGLSEHV